MLARSFKFANRDLNRCLITLLKKNGVAHSVDENGVIHYSRDDVEFVENDLIGSVRARAFPSWQVLTCPEDWTWCYKDYLARHEILFVEEFADGRLWFLIPRKYRPHAWKLKEPGSGRNGTPLGSGGDGHRQPPPVGKREKEKKIGIWS